MRLSLRETCRLRGIERRLRQSEPHMVAMLAIFARLCASEPFNSCEQARLPRSWARSALAALWGTLAAAADWVFNRAARTCAAARRRIGRIARGPLAPATWLDPRHSVGL